MCSCISAYLLWWQVLKLSHSTIAKLSIGNIVNLASNDVQRFDRVNIKYKYFITTKPRMM